MGEPIIHNGEDDYINDTGLRLLLELSEKLPSGFDVGTAQARPGSVTVTVYFPASDPSGQLEYLENVFMASQFFGALARNLKHERALRKEKE